MLHFTPDNRSFERWSRELGVGFFALMASFVSAPAHADNPIVQTLYTADPAPMVHEGRLYLYTTHDEDVTVNDFFTMNDWRVYSTTDVVNWTDHGSPLHYQDFAWASGNAWAGQVIYRNDKFYFYVPVVRPNGGNAIGVAVSDSPIGPFEDAIGAPLITSDCGDIDPTVFIDDDDQAYLYWGNPQLCYVMLNNDMTSYEGSVVKVSMNTGSFGVRADNERPTAYEEGPWFYKRNETYYLVYPGGPLPEHIAYATSTGPTGPWEYGGVIMPAEGTSFTNHPGVVDYAGKSLFFYHNGALPGGGGFKRSVAVEEFTYGPDGSIPALTMTNEGATAVASLNPFERVEAETIAWNEGIETEVCSQGGMNVTAIDNGDYIKLKEVEFGAGATSFEASVAATGPGEIEVRLDSADGSVVGTCAIASTGGADTWATQTCELAGAQGKHDVFLVFTGGGFKFDWWRVSGPGEPGEGSSESPDAGAPSESTSGSGSTSGDNSSSETASQAVSSAPTSTGSLGSTATSSSGATSSTSSASSTATTTSGTPSNDTAPATTSPVTTTATAPESSAGGSTSSGTDGQGNNAACGCRVGAQKQHAGQLLFAAAALAWLVKRRTRTQHGRVAA